ncbi:TIGR03826 family flagellar region protein [Defluviitalea phaphyphila]|uniref:TIGR03826 family flagellar region protein n=1 Tax=Defluviitalea phaphyphila TaxID=1473580 RepID=UPI000731B25B|nr:TIGR03826 family flagellar region protein [Defluviitalea phaphyphila]
MEIRNCKKCNRLFQYVTGRVICPACKEEEEKVFKKIKEYLYEHPKATLVQVSQETGASIPTIKHYIREGRLIITPESPIGIECERCGTMIKTGRFCEKCAYEIERDMKKATNGLIKNSTKYTNSNLKKSKMHYLNKNKIER